MTIQATPIMSSSNSYPHWDAFRNPETGLTLNHIYHNDTRIGVDGVLVPNGAILPVQPGLVSDFWTALKELGSNFNSSEIQGNCDAGCAGYDICFLP